MNAGGAEALPQVRHGGAEARLREGSGLASRQADGTRSKAEEAPDGDGAGANFPAALAAAGLMLNAEPAITGPSSGGAARSSSEAPTGQTLPPGGKTLPLLPLTQRPLPDGVEEAALAAAAGRGGTSQVLADGFDAVLEHALPKGTRPSAFSTPVAESDASARGQGALDLSFLNAASNAPERGRSAAELGQSAAAQYAVDARGRFEDGVGQRLIWMANQGTQDARVRVHPEHLGPIEIHVKLNGDAAHVSFSSPHSLVRDALTDAVPRLREMLGDAGLSLAQADVGSGGSHSGEAESRDTGFSSAGGDAVESMGGDAADAEREVRVSRVRRGIVDTFA